MGIRSFLAFEQPAEIGSVLREVSGALSGSRLDVRWVKPGNIHLTVVFLGNVREEDLAAMERPLEETCSRFGPFAVSLKGLGCFPHPRNPRVLWIGLDGDLERMAVFRDELQARLAPFGIQEEKRPFSPHLTLGRFNRFDRGNPELGQILEEHGNLSSPICLLGELVLFKSDLRRGGSIYTKMKSWRLTGEG